ncbi:hypothetical protein [Gracilimonas tropica]|uniref:hypothetical protein n=1 Tax=Gracilimonas tropica TaxID=454600 RepID=UPI00036376A9|nr:hypothetical protein [Gracilimonas tropica]
MIKIRNIILLFLFSACYVSPTSAQFINLQLKVEPELSATVEQDLDFGTQVTNSGRTEIQLGDINMGVFSIKAFHTQNVYLTLQYPESLESDNPANEAEIPLELNMAYNNTGQNSINGADILSDNNGMVSIHEDTRLESRNDIWKIMYIYVYGAINVGNVPNGVYTGDIVLSVDYD